MDKQLNSVLVICERVSCGVFGQQFMVRAERDNKRPEDGRIFLQITYKAECNKDGILKDWHGRKWYLSDHMTEDEVIKTLFVAFKSVVEHEIMEGFKVDDKILFNPHLSYTELLAISDREVKREEHTH